ncbi:CpaF family protein [Desulfofundulus thermosubterraneus]|uniref:Pilus assembly protein CpaF n=1 Tax=Desulfofundulus thermosubterraneus DSM 16057 TaxID=1121432 RepID=A0A1M6JAY0_9FIRM|nr:ATPase, T2SS/T4P/T4SS family [Desulfofundulus thermosubterraneus]SHJ43845.1 pilus assembly protein CpaF [Desulfofundulus thermosubterraneus DSM 16057]
MGLLERFSGRRPPLGEILKRNGVLDDAQLARALEEQRRTGQKLGEVLLSLGYVTRDELARALAEQERFRSGDAGRLAPAEHEALLKEVQVKVLARMGSARQQDVRQLLEPVCRDVLAARRPDLLGAVWEFAEDAYNRLFSLGPLEKYLQPGSDVTNIIVFGTKVMIERPGGIKEVDPEGFVSEEEVRRVFDRIAARAGKELSIANPSLDAELPDGSRVLLSVPPKGKKYYAAIRRHVRRSARLEELVAGLRGLDGLIPYFKKAVRERKNFVIAGSTNSGKTTLMNALLKEVQPLHTVAVLEDTWEIDLDELPFVAYFKTREVPGVPPITWGDILKDCLRFSPQRIVLTEVRTDEAACELIQTLNTGHEGSFTSIHAKSALDALLRLETLIQKKEKNLPIDVIRRLIARVVDVVVFVRLEENERGGVVGRRIDEVVEVGSDLLPDGMYDLREVFRI